MVFSCSIYMCHKIIFGIFEGMKKKEQRTQRTRYELTPPEFVLVRTSSLFFSCSSTYRRFIADSVVFFVPDDNKKLLQFTQKDFLRLRIMPLSGCARSWFHQFWRPI